MDVKAEKINYELGSNDEVRRFSDEGGNEDVKEKNIRKWIRSKKDDEQQMHQRILELMVSHFNQQVIVFFSKHAASFALLIDFLSFFFFLIFDKFKFDIDIDMIIIKIY